MFWGTTLTEGSKYSLKSAGNPGSMCHISHMVLSPAKSQAGSTTVYVQTGGATYPLGTLSADKTTRNLDLYFNTSSDTVFST
jgi:hypothetical protein